MKIARPCGSGCAEDILRLFILQGNLVHRSSLIRVDDVLRVEGFLDCTKVRTCSVSFPWLIRFPVVTLYRTVENCNNPHRVREWIRLDVTGCDSRSGQG